MIGDVLAAAVVVAAAALVTPKTPWSLIVASFGSGLLAASAEIRLAQLPDSATLTTTAAVEAAGNGPYLSAVAMTCWTVAAMTGALAARTIARTRRNGEPTAAPALPRALRARLGLTQASVADVGKHARRPEGRKVAPVAVAGDQSSDLAAAVDALHRGHLKPTPRATAARISLGAVTDTATGRAPQNRAATPSDKGSAKDPVKGPVKGLGRGAQRPAAGWDAIAAELDAARAATTTPETAAETGEVEVRAPFVRPPGYGEKRTSLEAFREVIDLLDADEYADAH